jgi:hypothetical protein
LAIFQVTLMVTMVTDLFIDTCPVANVSAGGNFEKSVKVEKADSVLSYRFKVADYNIGFSIAIEENGKVNYR